MTLPGSFNPGDVLTDTDMDDLPAGIQGGGYAQTTTATTGVTSSETDITGLSVTWTARANRRYMVTAVCDVIDSGSTSVYVVSLKDGASQLHRAAHVNGHTGANTVRVHYVNNTSISGSKTWKLTLVRASGAGTLSTTVAAGYPSFLLVQDIGRL